MSSPLVIPSLPSPTSCVAVKCEKLIVDCSSSSLGVLNWLTIAASGTALVLFLTTAYGFVRRRWHATYGSRRLFKEDLKKLKPLVNSDFVKSVFGHPMFGNLDAKGKGELAWLLKHADLFVGFDGHHMIWFSVTATDTRLDLEMSDYAGPNLSGVLGRRTYKDFRPRELLDVIFFGRGAQTIQYFEAFQAPHASGGLAYALGTSEWRGHGSVSAGGTDYPPDIYLAHHGVLSKAEEDAVDAIRANSVPDTLSVSVLLAHLDLGPRVMGFSRDEGISLM